MSHQSKKDIKLIIASDIHGNIGCRDKLIYPIDKLFTEIGVYDSEGYSIISNIATYFDCKRFKNRLLLVTQEFENQFIKNISLESIKTLDKAVLCFGYGAIGVKDNTQSFLDSLELYNDITEIVFYNVTSVDEMKITLSYHNNSNVCYSKLINSGIISTSMEYVIIGNNTFKRSEYEDVDCKDENGILHYVKSVYKKVNKS